MNEKLKKAIHYIVSLYAGRDKLSNVKLNKILWFADAIAFERTYDDITGARYMKARKGPVVEWGSIMYPTLKTLEVAGDIEMQGLTEDASPTAYKTAKPLTTGDAVKYLGQDAVDLIKALAETLDKYSDDEVSELTHNVAYKRAALNEELPLYVATFPKNLVIQLPQYFDPPIL